MTGGIPGTEHDIIARSRLNKGGGGGGVQPDLAVAWTTVDLELSMRDKKGVILPLTGESR
jgi:hypothetical protein